MARDTNRSVADYNLRCLYYKPVKTDRVIERDIKIEGLFYAKLNSQSRTSVVQGSVRKILFTTIIETPDDVNAVSIDYFVEYYGDIYRVINIDETILDRERKNFVITLQREVRE